MIVILKLNKFSPSAQDDVSESEKLTLWQNELNEMAAYIESFALPSNDRIEFISKINESLWSLQILRNLLTELTSARQNRMLPASRRAISTEKPVLDNNEIVIFMWPFRYVKGDYLYAEKTIHCVNCSQPTTQTCRFTSNMELFPQAEGVILVASHLTQNRMPPRQANQKWIFYSRESPNHVNLNKVDLKQFDNLFNATATYMQNSDIYNGYGKCRKRSTPHDIKKLNYSNDYVSSVFHSKTKLAAWFVSSCYTQSRREVYANKLKNFMTFDIYGRCGKLQCPSNDADCIDMLGYDYFFYFSFENSFCNDYITEKVYKIFHKGTVVVPVVMGGANYTELLPPKSFINVADFKTPKDLADYLTYLSRNETAYAEYFKWKEHFDCEMDREWRVPICNYMHATRHQPSTVESVEKAFSFQKQCRSPKLPK